MCYCLIRQRSREAGGSIFCCLIPVYYCIFAVAVIYSGLVFKGCMDKNAVIVLSAVTVLFPMTWMFVWRDSRPIRNFNWML